MLRSSRLAVHLRDLLIFSPCGQTDCFDFMPLHDVVMSLRNLKVLILGRIHFRPVKSSVSKRAKIRAGTSLLQRRDLDTLVLSWDFRNTTPCLLDTLLWFNTIQELRLSCLSVADFRAMWKQKEEAYNRLQVSVKSMTVTSPALYDHYKYGFDGSILPMLNLSNLTSLQASCFDEAAIAGLNKLLTTYGHRLERCDIRTSFLSPGAFLRGGTSNSGFIQYLCRLTHTLIYFL